jgi:hypothetical protein
MTIAIAKTSFRMPRGAVTSRQSKPMDNDRFVSTGEVFQAPNGEQGNLIGEKSRRYNIVTANAAANFLFLDTLPPCIWCALDIPRGSERAGCSNRQHAVGERENAYVIFIQDCTAL